MKLIREPLLHFMLIGAMIYLAYGLFAAPVEESRHNTLTVTAADIEWMQANWQKRWNRLPTEQELDGLIQHYIRETVLYREALTMGLNKHDPVIRRRLAQKMEFLARDLVALTPPTEQELQAYFQENQSCYQPPDRYSFTQIYLDPDKRGDATLDDARAMKTALAAQANAFDRAGEWGDDLMLQSHYSAVDQVEIHKQFGSDFAEALIGLEAGQWHGPLVSGYGVHLVYVHSRQQAAPVQFAEVRERVAQDWQSARSEELNDTFYANLRERYTIVIEKPKQDNNVTAMQEQNR